MASCRSCIATFCSFVRMLFPRHTSNIFGMCFHVNSRRCLLFAGRLVEILRLLEANNITAIPYKGPVLAASVYDNLVLRQAGDLDILVHSRDVSKAKALISSLGFFGSGPNDLGR